MTIEWNDILVGGLARCCIEVGNILSNYAITVGSAGPSEAIFSTAQIY